MHHEEHVKRVLNRCSLQVSAHREENYNLTETSGMCERPNTTIMKAGFFAVLRVVFKSETSEGNNKNGRFSVSFLI